jgi:tetratricopeptide (TPR) repeat protein
MADRLGPLLAAALLLLLPSPSARAQAPAEGRAALERAERALATGDFATAEREAEAAITAAPAVARAYDVLRYARYSTGKLEPLADRFKALAEANPDCAVYWYAYGRFAEGDPEAAERAFARVIVLAPNEPWGYLGQALVDKRAGRMAQSVALYEKALTLAPDEPSTLAGLSDALARMGGREAEADRLEKRLLAVAPDGYDAQSLLYRRATTALNSGGLSRTERFLDERPTSPFASSLLPRYVDVLIRKDPEAAVARVRELAKTGRIRRALVFHVLWQDARARGREAIDRLAAEVAGWNERDPGIYITLATLYLGEPDYAERARPLYEKAVGLAESATPRNEQILAHAKAAYESFNVEVLSRSDPAAAAKRARELLATAELRQRGYLYSFVLRDAVGRGPAAVEALAREQLADPKADLGILVATLRASDGIDADVEIQLITRALAVETPDDREELRARLNADLRARLGLAYLTKGDAARAVAVLESVEPKWDDGGAAHALARAYAVAGEAQKSYAAAVRAAARNPIAKVRATLDERARAVGRSRAEADAEVLAAREAGAYAAPDFELASLGGAKVSLGALRGKVVLLNFWFPG